MSIIRLLCALTLGLVTASCSIVPPAPEVALYQLPPPALGEQIVPTVPWSLRVKRPHTSDALNSTRLMLSRDNRELSPLPGARWVSPVPILLRDQVIAALNADGRIAHISSDNESLMADRELGGTLLAFQGISSRQNKQVVIIYDAVLSDTSSRHIIASHRFEIRDPYNDNDADVLVDSFARAMETLAGELVNWMVALESNP